MKLLTKRIINFSLKTRKVLLIILGSIVLILLLGWIVIWFIDKFDKNAAFLFNEAQKYRGELIKFTATVFGGVLLFYGLLLNARRTKALEKQNKLTRKGQVNERFKNAIEHLGSENDAIVLGGVYALHRIAMDDKSYRKTIFDILCSYLREKTAKLTLWSEYTEVERKNIKPSIVHQSIVDLLFKNETNEKYIYEGLCADLNGARCMKMNFMEAHLEGANLYETHLEGASLMEAYLEGANLSRAHLEGANLSRAHFEGDKFLRAHLEGAYLSGSHFEATKLMFAHLERAILLEIHLEGAILSGSHFEGADLSGSHLEGAVLSRVHFEGADLSSAHLEGADLSVSHLEGANLSRAHFEGANLSRAHFEGAYLLEAHLEGVNLSRAHFEGADLLEAHLEGANLYQVHFEGANLLEAHLEGANCTKQAACFIDRIFEQVGKESKIDENIIDGKLTREDADRIIDSFNLNPALYDSVKSDFKKTINEAIERNANIKKDAITGILTQEMADEIIARYNEAMKNVPKEECDNP